MAVLKIDKISDALIVVDVQNDFCRGGALAVANGDDVVPVINALVPKFANIFTTQDWHPYNHLSFKAYGGIWPPHCIAGTSGADLHQDLQVKLATHILKGTVATVNGYSGFQGTNLRRLLRKAEVKRLFIAGLATDYCIKATALDGIRDGFEVFVVSDAVKGVDISPGDSKKALAEMKQAGALIIQSKDIG